MKEEIKYCKFCDKEKNVKDFCKSGFAIKNICKECSNKKIKQQRDNAKRVEQLENNWKELKEWLEEEYEYDKNWYNPEKKEYIGQKHFPDDTIDGFRYVLDKMQEIESGKED